MMFEKHSPNALYSVFVWFTPGNRFKGYVHRRHSIEISFGILGIDGGSSTKHGYWEHTNTTFMHMMTMKITKHFEAWQSLNRLNNCLRFIFINPLTNYGFGWFCRRKTRIVSLYLELGWPTWNDNNTNTKRSTSASTHVLVYAINERL